MTENYTRELVKNPPKLLSNSGDSMTTKLHLNTTNQ